MEIWKFSIEKSSIKWTLNVPDLQNWLLTKIVFICLKVFVNLVNLQYLHFDLWYQFLKLKTSRACFFQCPDPTEPDYQHSDPGLRHQIFIFSPACKKFSPTRTDPEASIWSPSIPDIDWTTPVWGLFYVHHMLLIFHHFFYSVVYINVLSYKYQTLALDC